MIVLRTLRPGEAAPSIRKLAQTLAVTPATVERAYRRLIASGVLVAKRGRGTFVSEVAGPPMSDRDKLLEEAAILYATIARNVGAPLDEATGELSTAYTQLPAAIAATDAS
jgi:DNA-binding transcriptional regulator YhcF (GntR family)